MNMKASELMIGDWVITELGSVAIQIKVDDFKQIECNELIVNPIPLTEDILKSNGFQYGSHDYTYWPDEDGVEAPFHILQSNRYGLRIDIPYRVVTLRYVHELQHALRLCGLNELADNFKIV